MKPTVALLVRHGQAAVPDEHGRYRSEHPVPLTPTGEHQAAETANLLRGLRIDALYASTMLRARQTAEILAGTLELPVEYEDRLREVATGSLDGVTTDEVSTHHPEFLPWIRAGFQQGFATGTGHLDAGVRFPGGESVAEAADRAVAAFRDICLRHAGSCVVVVSHAWVISSILCHVIGIPVGSYYRIGQCNGGVAVVRADQNGRGMLDALGLGVALGDLAGRSLPTYSQSRTRG